MHTYYFSIRLSYEGCQQLYIAGKNAVIVIDEQGRKIQIPTKNLRPFINHAGIRGRFRLQVDAQNKLLSLEKMT